MRTSALVTSVMAYFILNQVVFIQSKGTLKLIMKEYHNKYGLTKDNMLCDWHPSGVDACDFYLVVRIIADGVTYHLGTGGKTKKAYRLHFGRTLGNNLGNFFVVFFENWKTPLKLEVDVWDKDGPGTMGDFIETIKADIPRHGYKGVPWTKGVAYGRRGGNDPGAYRNTLTYTYTILCHHHYTGKDCGSKRYR